MSFFTFLDKFVLNLFNLFCFISGVGILWIAYFMDKNIYKWSDFIDSSLITVPQILTVVGLVLLAIAIICTFLAPKNIKCHLSMLSFLLALILIGEFVLGGIVYHIRSEVEQHALQQMEYTINGYNQTGHETFRQSWNVLQSNIECCGISGPKDWKSVSRSGKLPASCCYALQIDESCTEINSYTNGCYDEFKNSLQHNNRIIFWSALGFALIQISAVILAFYTKCTVANEVNELNEYEKI